MTVTINFNLEQMLAIVVAHLTDEGIPIRGQGTLMYRGDYTDPYGMRVELDPLLLDVDTSHKLAALKARVPKDD